MKLPKVYRRPVYDEILERAHEPRRFIQVLAGPRQVGKTTLARQVMDAIGIPGHFASADAPDPEDIGWIYTQWAIGRQAAANGGRAGGLLVLDEVQKIRDWSDVVKQLWDEDSAGGTPLRVMLLGSAPLLVRQGLSDSLAGRFEIVRVTHWTYGEMRDAFGWDLDTYLFYGGYPGAAPLIKRHDRWEEYILDAIVETNLSRDILLLNRVEKPALLRQLFRLACSYSGQVLSYTKMLGTLTDAGNTVTLAHYLELLGGAGMVTGIGKYSGSAVRRRASSPKLLALNTALMTATSRIGFDRTRADPERWGAPGGDGGRRASLGARRSRRAGLVARGQQRGRLGGPSRPAHALARRSDGHRGEDRSPARRARDGGVHAHPSWRAIPDRRRGWHSRRGLPRQPPARVARPIGLSPAAR